MRLVLAGADYEENLGMCMIAAAAEAAGHRSFVVPFQNSDGRAEAVRRILALKPDVVGLAAQFQHRGLDYLALACDLRRAGFRGHLTAGGQYATMAYDPILTGGYGVDSVVLYEGEGTIAELLDAVAGKMAMKNVAGLALPDGKGGSFRTAVRPLAPSLDEIPLAQRYRQHSRQLGIPFIPVSGSRGCWASCSFCSITTVLRDGRDHGVAGRRFRLRSAEDVGGEMAMLAQAVGGSAVFCFHDENLLLPRPADSLRRLGAIKKVLDEQGVARAALVGKCRPDTVTKELARELARLGVVRMYVGIENASPNGAVHLNRGTDVTTMGAALDAFAEAGIFACYNLLVFEPQSTLDDVARNIAFMREHASTPINFCRAEPYLGTPLHRRLAAAGRLQGGFLGCDYRIEDDRAELLFRIAASAFRDHNFGCEGVANRYMSLGYSAKLLETFYQDDKGRCASLMERAQELTRSITLDTADLFERALDIAVRADLADHDLITRRTARLGLRVAASDRIWHAALDALEKDMSSFARGEAKATPRTFSRAVKAAQSAAVAGWLALWSASSISCGSATAVDQAPPSDGALNLDRDSLGNNDLIVVSDALPPDAGARDLAGDSTQAVDTEAVDGGTEDADDAEDAVDVRILEVDPLPPDSGARDVRDAGGNEPPFIVDPVVDARMGMQPLLADPDLRGATREHWAFTSPVRMKRSTDLPLCLCPEVHLAGEWQDGKVLAQLSGPTEGFSMRWQAQGHIEGTGPEVVWTPSSDEDQLDVAVRTVDGVAVTLLRLHQVARRLA